MDNSYLKQEIENYLFIDVNNELASYGIAHSRVAANNLLETVDENDILQNITLSFLVGAMVDDAEGAAEEELAEQYECAAISVEEELKALHCCSAI